MKEQTEVELIAWHPTGFKLTFIVQANQSVLVGKSSNCGVQLRGHDISDIHCSIGFEEGQLWIQDWMTASGTKVNNAPVTSQTFFGQGCVVEIGSYKIQISSAQKATLTTNSGNDAKHFTAAPHVDEENSIEQSSCKPIQKSAQSTVPVAKRNALPQNALPQNALPNSEMHHSETPLDDLPASELMAPTDETEHAHSTFKDTGVVPRMQPGSGIDLLAQEEETYDRETVELLLAEIDDLRTALSQADAQHVSVADSLPEDSDDADSDRVLARIQELSEEANRAEERVLLLEEMLHAAEDTNRSEVEERTHLEAWMGDIEKRVGQREAEHAAEIAALRQRLDSADKANAKLQRQVQHTGAEGECTDPHDGDVLEQLQRENGELQNTLAEVTKDLRQLKQKFENQSEESDTALREERAKIAREHADMSRLKYEYAQKIKELEELPASTAHADPSRQSLLEHRQHLRELNKGQKKRPASPSLSSRLKSIWNMID